MKFLSIVAMLAVFMTNLSFGIMTAETTLQDPANQDVSIPAKLPNSFALYCEQKKYYFSIPDTLLGREILVVSRIVYADISYPRNGLSRSSYKGSKTVNHTLIAHKIGLDSLSIVRHYRDLYFAPVPILQNQTAINDKRMFKISGTAIHCSIIDITPLLDPADSLLIIDEPRKNDLLISHSKVKAVSVSDIRNLSNRIEFDCVFENQNKALIQFHTSLLVLPKITMHPRLSDQRVNFFEHLPDAGTSPVIHRWRLESSNCVSGKLVEPDKPIIFYIDTSTPTKWQPYIKKGVEDWQVAFEKAGFKNAIQAKMIPSKAEDTSFIVFDINHSIVQWLPSNVRDATYSSIIDPRSGEIIQSHILLSTGGIELFKLNYMVQASPIDTAARWICMNDSIVGNRIRELVSHEVGHALGLKHNQLASFFTPVEKLRDSTWLSNNGGHTFSIMDYARYNYVAQPGDRIGAQGIDMRIGSFDEWSIEFGYRSFPNLSSSLENILLDSLCMARWRDKRFWYINETSTDPRLVAESLGDNHIIASTYGIRNLKFIMHNLVDWMKIYNGDDDELKTFYLKVVSQYNDYLVHVLVYIGGKYDSLPGQSAHSVPLKLQKKAVKFLQKNLFLDIDWLCDPIILASIHEHKQNVLGSLHSFFLSKLLDPNVLINMANAAQTTRKANTVIKRHLAKLYNLVFVNLKSGKTLTAEECSLQLAFLEDMKILNGYGKLSKLSSDQIKKTTSDIWNAYNRKTNISNQAHLHNLINNLGN